MTHISTRTIFSASQSKLSYSTIIFLYISLDLSKKSQLSMVIGPLELAGRLRDQGKGMEKTTILH